MDYEMKEFKPLISKSKRNVTIVIIMSETLLSQSGFLNENFVKKLF